MPITNHGSDTAPAERTVAVRMKSSRGKRQRRDDVDCPYTCDKCATLLSPKGLEDLKSQSDFRHHNLRDCADSAEKGCRLCHCFYHAACPRKAKFRGTKGSDGDYIVVRSTRQSLDKGVNEGSRGIIGMDLHLESEPQTCISTLLLLTEADNIKQRDVRSNAVFEAAKKLIGECTSSDQAPQAAHAHKHCRYSRDAVLPKRVIDVGTGDRMPSTVELKINETETHDSYLALSYCWGEMQQLLLRRNSLRDMEKSILVSDMSKSVRDAVFVTRKLGFRYIWVDAFCIMQDCPDDKEEQIASMASIYKNATVTIAAASSASAVDGFLSGNVPSDPQCLDISLPSSSGEQQHFRVIPQEYVPKHPLDSRGWAMQEYMLSSRMLIFSTHEVLWQCRAKDLQSVTGTGLSYTQPLQSIPWTIFEDDSHPEFGSGEGEQLYIWQTVVKQYTSRALTDPYDKLPAITGITMELEKLWRDECVYGSWKRWFVQLLAWYKAPEERVSKRALTRAPSWSWASLDKGIEFRGKLDSEHAKLHLLTVSTAQLRCQVTAADAFSDDVQEFPDLLKPSVDFENDKESEYLLLGTVQENNVRVGVGLLVLDVGGGVYRRLGMALFRDMKSWAKVQQRIVTLESILTDRKSGKSVF